jgi:hypothetical protein
MYQSSYWVLSAVILWELETLLVAHI